MYAGHTAPLNDAIIASSLSHGSLEFADQKNAVRGERVGHKPNSDPFYCPCKALARIAMRLQRDGATRTTPLYQHFNRHPKHRKWFSVTPALVTRALRLTASELPDTKGLDSSLLSSRSLRPGGATALLCANVGADAIMLLGRWKSDAMFRYLRIQAASANYAQLMLDHGAFSFHPQTAPHEAAVPVETPQAIIDLLEHNELYDDGDA